MDANKALEALEQLVYAYERGEMRGGVDWSDLDVAYERAIAAIAATDPVRLLAIRAKLKAEG